MASFHLYKPQSAQQKSSLRACETCYARKVRCDTGGHNSACSSCVAHGIGCKPRTRKRKAQLISDDGPQIGKDVQMGDETLRSSTVRTTHAQVQNERDGRAHSLTFEKAEGQNPTITTPYLFVTHQPIPPSISSPDAFHNGSFLSRTAILGDDFSGIDHSHGDKNTPHEHVIPNTDIEVLKIYKAFDLPDAPLRQSLVDAYIESAWTWMPVVDLSKLTGTYPTGDGSLVVLQAVLLVGALMRPEVCSKQFVEEQYRRVKALLNVGFERDPVHILTALCLVQWYTPTAPKDVSTDTPRAWATMAVGLAQQVGLHKLTPQLHGTHAGLCRRIWWTLCTRDSVMASAHGRPRMMNPDDSTNAIITLDDFEDPLDRRALIFVNYVKIVQILGDLCQVLTRHGRLNHEEREKTALQLSGYVDSMPEELTISKRGYDFELSQLHIPVLSTISILHRPRSVFAVSAANTASIVAASCAFRIFQAIELRGQTKLLSSAFAWHLLATSIPHLSALRVHKLRAEANMALDELEKVISTLGTVRPAGKQNLRNVRAIRRAITASKRCESSRRNTPDSMPPDNNDAAYSSPEGVLQAYGPEIMQHYHRVYTVLYDAQSTQGHIDHVQRQSLPATPQQFSREPSTPINQSSMDLPTPMNGYQDLFSNLFGDSITDNAWMRDWMDDLQLMPE